ncbi:hypothetical protein Rhe02_06320 [Rhizocola hellebori]|uniref:Serine protease n=1 Tax=Rhizocola hellebori TaxID=1392758 RepID=A0A8J3Q2G0_9ACTN|nr:hypothetical protein Rhe02_06320 [Rhizocola hellebori]
MAAVVALGFIAASTSTPAWSAPREEKPIIGNDDPKAGSNAAAELMALQAPLVDAAEAISRADKERTGLGGIRLRVKDRAADIYWKGEVPGEVREQIARLESIGYRAEVYEARYSGAELASAQEEILRARDAYPDIVTIAPLVDGSGLRIGFLKGEPKPIEWPVEVEVVDEDRMVFIDRATDTPPFWAGGVARLGGQVCSTGFAVGRQNWFTLTTGILTAEHCARGGGVSVTTGAGRFIGTAEVPSPQTAAFNSDSLFVPTNSAARMFDGAPVGAFSKPVVGWVNNFVGQFVCTSGASTGVHCDVITDLISSTALIQTGPTSFVRVDNLVFGTALGSSTAIAAGSGDSGGPVFTLTADFSKVRAAGLMSIAQFGVPCNVAGLPFCGNRVGFINIGSVLQAQQAFILT